MYIKYATPLLQAKLQAVIFFVIQYRYADMLAPDVVKNGLHDMKRQQIKQRDQLCNRQGQ